MATLTANGTKGHHKFTLTVTESSTSIPNNTSSLSYKFVLSPIEQSWNWEQWGTSISYTININGTNYTGYIPNYDGYSTVTLKSGSLSVGHSSDGSKTISISFSVTDGAGQRYTCGNASASGSMALTTIPQASSFSIPSSVEVGQTITANISRASSSFTHKVEFYFYPHENGRYDSTSSGWGTSRSFTIPNDWLNGIPDSTSRTAYCAVTTYNGSTQIGDRIKKEFTVKVPSAIVPTVGTITLDPVDVSGNNILLQNKNKLTISVSGCSAGTGSSIKSYVFSGPGISTTTTSTSVTGGPFSDTGTLTYTVKVTDNRGRTASKSATITCYAYSPPYFNSFSAYRCKSDGTADENGTYVKGSYNLGFSGANNTNNVTVKIFYKKNTATAYTSTTTLTSSKNTSGNFLLSPFNANSTYIFYAQITDIYNGKSLSNTITVFGSSRVLNVSSDGTGVAIGKMSESSHLFECRWDAQFLGAASGPSGFSTSSDRRVKKNIQDIDVDIVDNLQPIQYELVQSNDNKIHYGFIAQDVEKLLSEAGLDPETIGMIGQIQNSGQQEYVLAYTEFIPLLTKKCQELQAEINLLKEEISELKSDTT
jgi:hypothetical protein